MTLEEKERKINILRWILHSRWIMGTPLLVFAIFIAPIFIGFKIEMPSALLVLVIFNIIIAPVISLWLLRDKLKASPRVVTVISNFIIPLDIIVYTLLLYFLGGVGAAYILLFYFFAVITALAIYGRPLEMFLTAIGCSIFIAGEYLLELRFLPELPTKGRYWLLAPDPEVLLAYMLLFITILFMFTIIASFVAIALRQVTRELGREKDKISSIINVLPDGIIITDPVGRISLLNKSMENVTGVRYEELAGRKIDEKMTATNPGMKILYEILTEKIIPGEKKEIAVEAPYDRTFQVVEVKLQERKKTMGTIRILHDISREKTISRLKSEFISIAAHQLRTPLSAIKWTFRMLEEGDVGKITEEQKGFLEKGYQTNERMIKLVSDLLNVSRIEEGRFGYEFVKFSLETILDDLLADYTVRLREKNIDFVYEKPKEKLPEIKIDPQRIRLALQNILDNAIHYTLPGGKIILSLVEKESLVEIKIKDNGVGIPKQQMSRLFTKFFRGENVMRMQTEGSGLGLYIVKNIIKRHGGVILIESEEGKGTTATLTLPLHEKDVPTKETPFVEGI